MAEVKKEEKKEEEKIEAESVSKPNGEPPAEQDTSEEAKQEGEVAGELAGVAGREDGTAPGVKNCCWGVSSKSVPGVLTGVPLDWRFGVDGGGRITPLLYSATNSCNHRFEGQGR